MAVTNPTKFITVRRLERYNQKLADVFADKDSDAVVNNIAKFDSEGNPVDSGKSINDIKPFATTQTCADIVYELT